jgi:methylated-DNA-[protein]-cysteine S-methyltransferase
MNFKKKVLKVVRRIKKGKVMTYKEVAKLAGSPKAFRAVGNILNKNEDPGIPCHRVIRSDGNIGGYRKGAKKKAALLKRESAIIKNNFL